MKPEWLRRDLTICSYCYCLCLTEEAFYAELNDLGMEVGGRPKFVRNTQSHAVTWLIPVAQCTNTNFPVAIVCIDGWEKHDPIVIAGLLVHEAVHIWQAHARDIGSFNDHGDEEEAYAIQMISLQLMNSFVEQTK